MSQTTLVAITLFRMKPGHTVDEYRAFAHQVIRPGMAKMPSVTGFMDYWITGSMTPTDGGWQLAEIVRITSAAEFERDNQELPGLLIAQQWNEWVEEALVIYLAEL